MSQIGSGIVTFSGSNSYSGGTTLTAGELSISASNNLGAATSPVAFNGGVLQITGTAVTSMGSHAVNWSTFNGGFDVADAANVFSVTSAVSGAGSLTKRGAGTLSLSNASAYAGDMEIEQGVLALPNGLGTPGTPIAIDAAGELSAANLVNRAVTGPGTLTCTGPLVVGDMTNPAGFSLSGTLNVGGNNVLLMSAGTVQLGAATNLAAGGRLDTFNGAQLGPASSVDPAQTLTASGNATVVGNFINNGAVIGPASPASLTFDYAVTGSGSFQGNVQLLSSYTLSGAPLQVGGGNLSVLGVQGSQGLSKTGSGVLTLNGPNSYSGGTSVDGGTLVVNSSTALPSGTGLYVALGATVYLGDPPAGFAGSPGDFGGAGPLPTAAPSFNNKVVPEPGTLALLAAGLACGGVLALRRRRAHAGSRGAPLIL